MQEVTARGAWRMGAWVPRLIDGLSDDETTEALASLESRLTDQTKPALPEFFGRLHSGEEDPTARSDEILRAEFRRR